MSLSVPPIPAAVGVLKITVNVNLVDPSSVRFETGK